MSVATARHRHRRPGRRREEHHRARARGAPRSRVPRHRRDVPGGHVRRHASGCRSTTPTRSAALARVEVDARGRASAASLVDGVDATAAIRTPEVTGDVSKVAANSGVRAEMRARQRAWAAERGGGVIEGRDIGSVVFPDAELKLYLTASPRVRAERRRGRGGRRRRRDRGGHRRARPLRLDTRADSPLAEADGSACVDTTGLTHRRGPRPHPPSLPGQRRGMTKIDVTRPRRRSPATAAVAPDRVLHRPQPVVTVLPHLVPHDGRGPRERARRRASSSSPRRTAASSTRPSRRGVTRRRMRFMGADKWWSNKLVRPAAVRARRLPGHPRLGRP